MGVLKRRSRMVSFRLSEPEYNELMALCSVRGARSLSDLVRDAMQALLSEAGSTSDHGNGKNGNHHGPALEINTLLNRLDEMDYELKRLASLVDPPRLAAEKTA
jgi:hypothetical protein